MTPLLDTHVVETGADPRIAILWLHGLGADGFDFAPIVPELVSKDWPAIRFVFPHAPVRAVTVNNGHRMRAWYDLSNLDFEDRADLNGVRESIDQLDALIDDQIAKGIDPSRILLAGFSQGGAIVLTALLKSRHTVPAAIALSTYLPDMRNAIPAARESGRSTTTQLFMAHGTQDPVVPVTAGDRSAAALTEMGFNVDWRTYPIQHQVGAIELADLRHWLGQILTTLQ